MWSHVTSLACMWLCRRLIDSGAITEADLPDCLFATKPSNGAALLRLKA